jgi:hypothetical protein
MGYEAPRRRLRARPHHPGREIHEYVKRDLSTGAKIGIAVGVAAGFVLLCLLCNALLPANVGVW